MLIDAAEMLPPFSPVAAEIRPYVGEGFPLLGNFEHSAFYIPALKSSSATSSTCNYVFLYFGKNLQLETNDTAAVTHEEIRSNIDNVCYDLKLSKSALAEILGVSRQTIYDWLSGKNENFKSENISKIEWLSELSHNLDSDVKNKLWLWKDKKLSDGLTIKTALGGSEIPPEKLAADINIALNKWRNVSRIETKSQQGSGRELVDKSVPFKNND